MVDLELSGTLNLSGDLNLSGSGGGKVKVVKDMVKDEILVVSGQPTGTATIPVLQPSPPAIPSPLNGGLKVRILQSFNVTVTIANLPVVAQGICLQGDPIPPTFTQIWPGMVLPSVSNKTVTISGVPANVKGDRGITLPSGGSINFDDSGQPS